MRIFYWKAEKQIELTIGNIGIPIDIEKLKEFLKMYELVKPFYGVNHKSFRYWCLKPKIKFQP